MNGIVLYIDDDEDNIFLVRRLFERKRPDIQLHAAMTGRFGEGDLASVIAHLAGAYSPARACQLITALGRLLDEDGQLTHFLHFSIEMQGLVDLLRKNLGPGQVAGIFDRNFKYVARSGQPEQFIGEPAPPSFVQEAKVALT